MCENKKKKFCNDLLHFSCFAFSRCIKLSHNVRAKMLFLLCLIRNDRTNFDEIWYIAFAMPGYAVSLSLFP
jgi:hypothetical protein